MKDETEGIFHLPPIEIEKLEDPEYAWSRTWVILNTLATIAGAMTATAALIIAVIALKS